MSTRHDKATVVREYCLARRIPYRISGHADSLLVRDRNGHYHTVMFSVHNHTYRELFEFIDNEVTYDSDGFFVGMWGE